MKENTELQNLCLHINEMVHERKEGYINIAKEEICQAMAKYPDACEPHNLMGIIKVIENDKVGAMKHFRAAYALDPVNVYVRKNIDILCAFRGRISGLLFGDEDIAVKKEKKYFVEYDSHGIGHIKRRESRI